MIKVNLQKTSGLQQKLNILHINKFHYLRGGSEVVYFNTSKLMESHGHNSIYFSMHHQANIPGETNNYFMPYVALDSNGNGIMEKIKTAGRILYSFEAKNRLSKLLDKYSIDIAHLHNIHHQISPSILHELKRRGVPVVMTLHDYKMVCASYSMLSNGKPCEACGGKDFFQVVKKKCVKQSFGKSILAAFEMFLHHKLIDIYDNVDLFITPSKFLKNKLEEMGFSKKIVHLPNFIDATKFTYSKNENEINNENSIVYYGRLSPEKGLHTLLRAVKISNAENRTILKIIGDGPIKGELEEKVKLDGIDNVKFLGYMKGESLYNEIRRSMFVIIPSEWYENNPMSALEAFAMEKPIIGSRIGGIPELVKNGETGYTFEPGNAKDLSEKINTLFYDNAACIKMGLNARRFVESEFNPEKHYQDLLNIYQKAIKKS